MAKILFVSSGGGHFAELKKLNQVMSDHETIIVTEKKATWNHKKINYTLFKGSRENKLKFLFVLLLNSIKSLFILIRVRPKIIISTGAHSCVAFFYLGKLFRCKIIYIESFAKVTSPSLTYKLTKRVIDVLFVQHEELIDIYPGSLYIGGVY